MSCANKFSAFITDGTCSIDLENFMTNKVHYIWDHDANTDSWHGSDLLENPSNDSDNLTDTCDTDEESCDCFEEDADSFVVNDDYNFSFGVDDDDISTNSM